MSPTIDSIIQAAPQLLAVGAALLAIATYRKNAKTKRAEWLSTLHGKFFESTTYKGIRSVLDYGQPELETLRKCAESGEYHALVESLVDYLNFFEFIASLWKLGQLDIKEVLILFEYYLDNLTTHKFVTDFITAYDFDNLKQLLTAVADRRKDKRS